MILHSPQSGSGGGGGAGIQPHNMNNMMMDSMDGMGNQHPDNVKFENERINALSRNNSRMSAMRQPQVRK